MTPLSLALSLLLGPELDESGHWYNRKACEVFSSHSCSWRWSSARRCEEPDDQMACVILTHPTAYENEPHQFLGVYSAEGLVAMSVLDRGAYKRLF